MMKFIDLISDIVKKAFTKCGYKEEYGLVTLSSRPDLCQFQCNGALPAAKYYKKTPILIANEVSDLLKQSSIFKEITCVMPGFINLTLNDHFITDYIDQMFITPQLGCSKIDSPQTIIVDYGGPNVAKPLHVGHLRTAIIGESIKRMGNYLGYNMLGDVHLGDWGLPIGLIITELKKRKPHLVYFDANYDHLYPTNPPFTISELEEIYPAASSFAKENPDFMEEAKQATYLFQIGHKGYVALWQHILEVSVNDLKKNYAFLNVYFDLWKKESDAQPYIPAMIEKLQKDGFAYMSEGALVVDIKEPTDTKEMPPCILVKSDGATLYSTTDLATIVERMSLYKPSEIIYIVDKRQEMHFEQVFRCAKKTHLVDDYTQLTFLGFGTMNGKDGKPFKTRDGGVMRLEQLLKEVKHKVYEKVSLNASITHSEADEIAQIISVAALKYGDLSNQIAKDYIFDLDRFTAFEGNTGPYMLYTVVRIRSILNKFYHNHPKIALEKITHYGAMQSEERELMLKLTQFNETIPMAFKEYAPHKLCQYIYELSNAFNRFYHANKIISEQDQEKQLSWIKLISLAEAILVICLDLLGIETPEKM